MAIQLLLKAANLLGEAMKIVTAIALVLICVSGHANAADKNQFQMGEVTKLFDGSFDVTSKQDRLRIAQSLLKPITELKAYLPSLTPDQERWLKMERSSFDSVKGDALESKLKAFSMSSEVQLEALHWALDQIQIALNCVLNKKNSLNQELFCWAAANLALTHSNHIDYAIDRLDFLKVVDFSPNIRKQFLLFNASDDNTWRLYNLFGRGIQEHIVLPLIRNGAK